MLTYVNYECRYGCSTEHEWDPPFLVGESSAVCPENPAEAWRQCWWCRDEILVGWVAPTACRDACHGDAVYICSYCVEERFICDRGEQYIIGDRESTPNGDFCASCVTDDDWVEDECDCEDCRYDRGEDSRQDVPSTDPYLDPYTETYHADPAPGRIDVRTIDLIDRSTWLGRAVV